MLLIWLLISSFAFAASVSTSSPAPKTPTCPAGVSMDDSNINSKSLQAMVQSKKLSMRELICCLPKTWRDSYVIMPDSRSAQSGTSGRAPRVIIFNPNSRYLNLALSFVDEDVPVADASAKENMQSGQRYSVEMAEYNEGSGETRFSDLHFSKDQARKVPGISEEEIRKHHNGDLKNDPEKKCSLCHDPDSDGRLKTVFPMLPLWSGAFGRFATSMCLSPEEKEYDQKQRDEFLKVLEKGDTAYSCLVNVREKLLGTPQSSAALSLRPCSEKEPSHCNLSKALFQFDALVRNSDDKYFYDRISKTPDFDKYKYAMMATFLSCKMDNLEDYFPPEALKDMSQRKGIANDPPLNVENLQAHIKKGKCHGDCSVFDNSFRMPEKCANSNDSEFQNSNTQVRDGNLWKLLSDESGSAAEKLRRVYEADTILKKGRTFQGNQTEAESLANFRFLFESRGIAIAHMGTSSPTGDYVSLMGFGRINRLVELDKDLNTVLKSYLSKGPEFFDFRSFDSKAACSKLQNASVNAFKKSNPTSSPIIKTEATQ